jgi:hypothetical protein
VLRWVRFGERVVVVGRGKPKDNEEVSLLETLVLVVDDGDCRGI